MVLIRSLVVPLLVAFDTLANITVLVPVGGETIISGESTTISWDPATNIINSTLAILLEQGDPTDASPVRVVQSLAPGGVANEGSFLWMVDPGIPPGDGYFVRIQDGEDTDWTGGLGDNPPQANARYGLSGSFSINSATMNISNFTTLTTTVTVTAIPSPTSSSSTFPQLSSTPQPSSIPQNTTIGNDNPNITYYPPGSWNPAPATDTCTASSVEKVSRTAGATISFNFTGEFFLSKKTLIF
jgi:Ser-Thr-rich glycosyl-phosphatidyl-inositol-anchored membrane family